MTTRSSWILLAASTAFFLTVTRQEASELPQRAATHFDGAGRPNGWMSARDYLISTILTGLGVPAFVLGICYAARFFPPSTLNVPRAAFWQAPENHRRACTLLSRWSLWFATASMLWTTAMHHELVKANRLTPPRLSNAMVMGWSSLYLASLLVLIILLLVQFTRVPPSHAPPGAAPKTPR